MELLPTPKDLLEQMAELRFDADTDARLQELMDRNNFGELSESERAELARYAALNQQMTIIRGRAMIVLGRKLA
jgi:hypothetical protein